MVITAVVVLIKLQIPVFTMLLEIGLLAVIVLFLFWLFWRGSRRLLWRVGRRLAFSYFLIGLLPIPMALLDAVDQRLHPQRLLPRTPLSRTPSKAFSTTSTGVAQSQLVAPTGSRVKRRDVALASYRNGTRQWGSEITPEDWPEWLAGAQGERYRGISRAAEALCRRSSRLPTANRQIAIAVGTARDGVVAVYTGDLGRELSTRSEVWIGLIRSDAPEQPSLVHVQLGTRRIPIRPIQLARGGEGRDQFFSLDPDTPLPYFDSPRVWWGELTPSLKTLEDGSEVAEYVVASLNGSPSTSFKHFFSSSAEVDTAVWAGLIGISGLLTTIYAMAVTMALVIIIALTRAVNRLSTATSTVSEGDFSVRIPAKRKDQIGQLQRDFNLMTEHLEQLVETAAQKEVYRQGALSRQGHPGEPDPVRPAPGRVDRVRHPVRAQCRDRRRLLRYSAHRR